MISRFLLASVLYLIDIIEVFDLDFDYDYGFRFFDNFFDNKYNNINALLYL